MGCIIYLCSSTTIMGTFFSYVSLWTISRIDNMYAGSLSKVSNLKGNLTDEETFMVKECRVDLFAKENACTEKLFWWIYKFHRIIYCSFIYYFLPYVIVLAPYAEILFDHDHDDHVEA